MTNTTKDKDPVYIRYAFAFNDGEVVEAQPGGFYGGWITRDIVGPFKGEPGTEFW